jgi:hypothetical protein
MRLHPASPQTERVVLKDDCLPLRHPIKTKTGKTLTSLSLKTGQVRVMSFHRARVPVHLLLSVNRVFTLARRVMQVIHIPFMSMQTLPAVWGEDGMMFKPERWLSEGALPSPAERPHGWSGLVTFCDGPR